MALRETAKRNAAFKESAYDKFGMGNKPQHESEWQIADQLQALLDVAVAADWMDPDERSKVLNHHLDKLREISDE